MTVPAPQDPPISDLLFPLASTSVSHTLNALKRSTLSITNRLTSISTDSAFICAVADAYGLPLIANERCGSWYIPLQRKSGCAYFKSTDGHAGQWGFSLRRLNLQVLDLVAVNGGYATLARGDAVHNRRFYEEREEWVSAQKLWIDDGWLTGGWDEEMPDALSKTIPIWCAVLNRILFPLDINAGQLQSPPLSVSKSEHSQIEARLDGFVQGFSELQLDMSGISEKIKKPLRSIWVTQDSQLPLDIPQYEDFHPVVLCTASRRVPGGEASEGGYIQGAGDDSEGWAHGLTPPIYWKHKQQLMNTSEADLPDLIALLVAEDTTTIKDCTFTLIKPTAILFIGTLNITTSPSAEDFDCLITCGEQAVEGLSKGISSKLLYLRCSAGKLGSRDLRKALPKARDFLRTRKDLPRKVLVACNLTDIQEGQSIDKKFIRQRLSWIITSKPDVNPSRSTLQSVNSFLMERPDG
ncbi:MAG: hypothetical protein M1827_000491 [Pycnora praestabilis]|nr:MAG: hypothetical protein M1827_000491 [Pycnora praestabilis]